MNENICPYCGATQSGKPDPAHYAYAVCIYNQDGYRPMAIIATGDGGRPNATHEIPWDDLRARGQYVVNSYTFMYDERVCPGARKRFEQYVATGSIQ